MKIKLAIQLKKTLKLIIMGIEIMKRMIIIGMEIMERMRKKYEYPSQAKRQVKRQENMPKSMDKMEENGGEKIHTYQ